jgi:tripartite-type tricarboxylate transporter receptor subunit TctC
MTFSTARRHFLRAASATTLAMSTPWLGAQPRSEAARVICGYPAGGSVDIVARRLAERLGKGYSRSAVVENRPGAAGRLAVDALKSSPADGSTLLVTPGSVLTMYPHIYRPIGYDVFIDLAPVAMVASTEFCLAVGPAVPGNVQTLSDFSAWCRANPGLANCGNAGAGSFPHFMSLLMARETGIAMNHVPYRGGSAAMLALTGGQVAAALATEGAALTLEQAGKLRVLATTAVQRSAFFPKSPSFASLGYKLLTQREWFAVVAPAQTPASVQNAVADEVRGMLGEADARDAWGRLGLVTTSSTPAELRLALRAEFDFWGPIIKSSGFTPEA